MSNCQKLTRSTIKITHSIQERKIIKKLFRPFCDFLVKILKQSPAFMVVLMNLAIVRFYGLDPFSVKTSPGSGSDNFPQRPHSQLIREVII